MFAAGMALTIVGQGIYFAFFGGDGCGWIVGLGVTVTGQAFVIGSFLRRRMLRKKGGA